MRYTNVGDLKRILADLPDNTPVLVPSLDHSYREAEATAGHALYNREHDHWSEWHSAAYADPGEKPTRVLIVR